MQCKLYQLGKCHLGAACNEYHGNMDLKKKNYQYKKSVCQDYLQGHCEKGYKICIYVHPGEEDVEGFEEYCIGEREDAEGKGAEEEREIVEGE